MAKMLIEQIEGNIENMEACTAKMPQLDEYKARVMEAYDVVLNEYIYNGRIRRHSNDVLLVRFKAWRKAYVEEFRK